jgi:hypothetical protein
MLKKQNTEKKTTLMNFKKNKACLSVDRQAFYLKNTQNFNQLILTKQTFNKTFYENRMCVFNFASQRLNFKTRPKAG